MNNAETYTYTDADYRRFISEILEHIDDLEYTKKIYSLVFARWQRPRERGQQ